MTDIQVQFVSNDRVEGRQRVSQLLCKLGRYERNVALVSMQSTPVIMMVENWILMLWID